MGGAAFIVYGSVNKELEAPRPVQRTIVDRLLGRQRDNSPHWSQLGQGRKMITLTDSALKSVVDEFRHDMVARISRPWESTKSIFEYLKIDVMTVYVRGDAVEPNPPEWYVQFTFSGCAGMADVSCLLATHWCELWYAEKKDEIAARHLLPYGFVPNGRVEHDEEPPIYVPFGVAGYAMMNAEPNAEDEEYFESRYFQIDGAAMETLEESERKRVLQTIDREIPPLIRGNRCLCQLCSPDYDTSKVDALIPFHDER